MISIIIPVYNEAARLPQLLAQLAAWQGETRHEVIFVDGGSSDDTCAQIERAHYPVYHEKPGRGQQLIRGVQESQGEILFFLHADSRFLTCPLPLIVKTCQTHAFGAFRLRYPPGHPVLRLISWGANWRVRYRHIAFGDQGMFLTRQAYQDSGGFPALPLMEDYAFSLQARQRGIICTLVSQKVISSDRYFRRHGIFRGWYRMQKCQWLFRHGYAIETIQAEYQRP